MKYYTLTNVVNSIDELPNTRISLIIKFGAKTFQLIGSVHNYYDFLDSGVGYIERIADTEIKSVSIKNGLLVFTIALSDYIFPNMNSEFIDVLLAQCEKSDLSVAG